MWHVDLTFVRSSGRSAACRQLSLTDGVGCENLWCLGAVVGLGCNVRQDCIANGHSWRVLKWNWSCIVPAISFVAVCGPWSCVLNRKTLLHDLAAINEYEGIISQHAMRSSLFEQVLRHTPSTRPPNAVSANVSPTALSSFYALTDNTCGVTRRGKLELCLKSIAGRDRQ